MRALGVTQVMCRSLIVHVPTRIDADATVHITCYHAALVQAQVFCRLALCRLLDGQSSALSMVVRSEGAAQQNGLARVWCGTSFFSFDRCLASMSHLCHGAEMHVSLHMGQWWALYVMPFRSPTPVTAAFLDIFMGCRHIDFWCQRGGAARTEGRQPVEVVLVRTLMLAEANPCAPSHSV